MKTLGEQLRAIRERDDISQETVAKGAGIRPGHLSRIENGKISNPSIDILRRLASYLGVMIVLDKKGARVE